MNVSSNQNDESLTINDSLDAPDSKYTNDVDYSMPEYQPLLPSTHADKKFVRKPSTFVVTPVSILDSNAETSHPQQVNMS